MESRVLSGSEVPKKRPLSGASPNEKTELLRLMNSYTKAGNDSQKMSSKDFKGLESLLDKFGKKNEIGVLKANIGFLVDAATKNVGKGKSISTNLLIKHFELIEGMEKSQIKDLLDIFPKLAELDLSLATINPPERDEEVVRHALNTATQFAEDNKGFSIKKVFDKKVAERGQEHVEDERKHAELKRSELKIKKSTKKFKVAKRLKIAAKNVIKFGGRLSRLLVNIPKVSSSFIKIFVKKKSEQKVLIKLERSLSKLGRQISRFNNSIENKELGKAKEIRGKIKDTLKKIEKSRVYQQIMYSKKPFELFRRKAEGLKVLKKVFKPKQKLTKYLSDPRVVSTYKNIFTRVSNYTTLMKRETDLARARANVRRNLQKVAKSCQDLSQGMGNRLKEVETILKPAKGRLGPASKGLDNLAHSISDFRKQVAAFNAGIRGGKVKSAREMLEKMEKALKKLEKNEIYKEVMTSGKPVKDRKPMKNFLNKKGRGLKYNTIKTQYKSIFFSMEAIFNIAKKGISKPHR